jgi:hypothetical protein
VWTDEKVLKKQKRTVIRGRGGVGFHRRVEMEAGEGTEWSKYIICNADEGDRRFMDSQHFGRRSAQCMEGMMIGDMRSGRTRDMFSPCGIPPCGRTARRSPLSGACLRLWEKIFLEASFV